MYAQLRQVNARTIDLDEAVALLAFGRMVEAEFKNQGGGPPDWLSSVMTSLTKSIVERREEMLRARLSEVVSRRAALRTAEERRRDLDAEEASIRRLLGEAAE
jgi:hypothetical protein